MRVNIDQITVYQSLFINKANVNRGSRNGMTCNIILHIVSDTLALALSLVHTMGIQLVPEILLLVSDALYTQYRHIEHLHEEVRCLKLFVYKTAVF